MRRRIAQKVLNPEWHSLNVKPAELRIGVTLTNGQSFNWKRYPRPTENEGKNAQFYGALGDRVFLLRQTQDDVFFRVVAEPNTSGSHGVGEGERLRSAKEALHDYFQLSVNLESLYTRWGERSDKKFRSIAKALPGMRVVRQDPVECLFSFICSSCNNIPRITQMLDFLRSKYGDLLWKDKTAGVECYSFPTIETLANIPLTYNPKTNKPEAMPLRETGHSFGYRAESIVHTAQSLNGMTEPAGKDFLHGLRDCDHAAVRRELLKFRGVGPKVADCVALFSLDQTSCVPVDTHVWQIACRDFDPTLKDVTCTPGRHERVNNLFVDCFGDHAGWAHSVLFAAELEQFYPHLPPQVVDEIVKGKQERKEDKAKKAKELAKKRKLKLETELNESVKLEVSEKSPKKKKSRTKKKIKAEAD